MEVERDASLPFIGVELLNLAPRIKTKVYVKPTNTGLLLHYQSHVDNRYKRSLITTMLDRACRISSDWSYFSQECDRLETVLLKLKYPRHLFNLAVKQYKMMLYDNIDLIRVFCFVSLAIVRRYCSKKK